ncbi:MAG: DUF4258 domain-containing protein [Candidatus Heimdallarchaeota archaeon]|nr:MAG: DUF4258 domain-containing protein [Candidatus Heimdallarchaeota archaeon]
MKIQFSEHALERMRARNLTTDQIKEAITNPDEQLPNEIGKVAHKVLNDNTTPEKYLLRVFYKEEEDRIFVISAYKTVKIEKYWKGESHED